MRRSITIYYAALPLNCVYTLHLFFLCYLFSPIMSHFFQLFFCCSIVLLFYSSILLFFHYLIVLFFYYSIILFFYSFILLLFYQGMWLLSNLVAAINPHDLDALDEAVPLTKFTLDGAWQWKSSSSGRSRSRRSRSSSSSS
jgi:hypothetical protein